MYDVPETDSDPPDRYGWLKYGKWGRDGDGNGPADRKATAARCAEGSLRSAGPL